MHNSYFGPPPTFKEEKIERLCVRCNECFPIDRNNYDHREEQVCPACAENEIAMYAFEKKYPNFTIKVEASTSGWGAPWYAYSEQLGGIDYDWTGDGWRACGSPIGDGRTIQEAIEAFLESDEVPAGISYVWN